VLWNDAHEAFLPSGPAHSKQIFAVAINSDHTKLFSLGGEEVKILDLATKTFEHSVEAKGQVLDLKAANTDPKSYFVLLENNLVLKFTETAQVQEYKLDYETASFAVSADDEFIFVGDKQGYVHQIESVSGKEVHKYLHWNSRVTTITTSADAARKWVAAGDSTGKIRLWNYEDKKVKSTLHCRN
jgi:WD40 repeat protein